MDVRNGKQTKFWRDKWIGNGPLEYRFLDNYVVCYEQVASVKAMADNNWKLAFGIWLDSAQMIC